MSRRDQGTHKSNGGRPGKGETKKSQKRDDSSMDATRKPGSTARDKAPVEKKSHQGEGGMRLNKYIANSGICSRRDADLYISSGNVVVNGKVITEMGYKVQATDEVKFDGRLIRPDKPEYIVLNKPKGVYVTGNLEQKNRTVMDLVANASKAKLDPVGKLDTQAMGLLLFTNDGALAKKLANPRGIRQIYHLELDKEVAPEDLEKIRSGVYIEGKAVTVADVSYVENRPKKEIGIELQSIRKHIVQRIFKSLGYEVVKLDRVIYGGLTKKDLPRGRWRVLTKQEVINLKNL